MSRCPNCQHDGSNCNCNWLAESRRREAHTHNWVFLRQSSQRVGTYDYGGLWDIYDVFYCSSCNEYKQVLTKSRHQGLYGISPLKYGI